MDYSFERGVDRSGTFALKWELPEGVLPMWVADMDLPTAPCVKEALIERCQKPAFGYSTVPPEWYEAYTGWLRRRHGFKAEKEWLLFTTGTVPAISSMVRKLTTIGEQVLLLTPVYNIFRNSIVNNGRRILECPLKYDGTYSIDYQDLEEKLSEGETTLLIFCNPHNPIGRIWKREELEQVAKLCEKHGVTVISDEIHGDLTDMGCVYTPFASVYDKCITCLSPSKSFNLAGLQSAAVMVKDPQLRHKVWRSLNTDEVAEPNSFAITSTIAAYNGGSAYLDALRAYLKGNKEYVRTFISENLPELKVVPSNATYLLWIDCSALSGSAAEAAEYLEAHGLCVSAGYVYGKGGEDFLRLNVAQPRALTVEGMKRFKKGIEEYQEMARGRG